MGWMETLSRVILLFLLLLEGACETSNGLGSFLLKTGFLSQTTLLEEAIAADIHSITAQGYASILRIMGNFMVSL
jgi:hypothetical protein